MASTDARAPAPPSPQCTPYAARFESRAIAHLWHRRPAKKHEISSPEIDDELLRRGRGTGQREKQGKAQCGHGGWRARLSPLDVQCVFIKNQYRSVLIDSSSPREVCVCGRGCDAWVCGCGVQAQQRGSSDKCLIVIMPSGSGSGPPKPPLTRHRVSSSEREGRCGAGKCEGECEAGGQAGWRESVLSIHDPWCYTLSCNTCNLSRHPLSRAVCGAVRCGAWGGNCSDPQPSDELESATEVSCLLSR